MPIYLPNEEEEVVASQIPETELIEVRQKDSPIYKFVVSVNEKEAHTIPIIMIKDKEVMTVNNISCIVGKAKSKKSFACSAIVAAFIIGGKVLGFSGMAENSEEVALVVDSEQARKDVIRYKSNIMRQSGFSSEDEPSLKRLVVVTIRELNTIDRMKALKLAVKTFRPKLLVIDGIRDFVTDINDQNQATYIANTLMSISVVYNCHIVNVIHLNKKDMNLRGALGTELINKSELVIHVAPISKKTSRVEPMASRSTAPFDPFYIYINKEGLPAIDKNPYPKKDDGVKPIGTRQTKAMQKAQEEEEVQERDELQSIEDKKFQSAKKQKLKGIDKMRIAIERIYSKSQSPNSYVRIIQRLTDLTGMAESSIKQLMPKAVELGYLQKEDNKYYSGESLTI